MHHLSMGCEYQTKEDIRVYASIGFECSNYRDFRVKSNSWRYYYDGICNISGHPRNENHYHYEYDIYEWYSYFLSLRVGVTFSQDKISLMRLTRDGISKLKKKWKKSAELLLRIFIYDLSVQQMLCQNEGAVKWPSWERREFTFVNDRARKRWPLCSAPLSQSIIHFTSCPYHPCQDS